MVGTCFPTYSSLLTGTKLEKTGNTRQTVTQNMKITHVMIGTTKLVTKYFSEKMVSSTNQRVGMSVILGLSHQFIQMGQLGFNAEQSQNDWILGESHLFLTTRLNSHKCYFFRLSPSYTNTYALLNSWSLSWHLCGQWTNFFYLTKVFSASTLILHSWGQVT